MSRILLHGLGQNANDWNKVKEFLNKDDIIVECPDLFRTLKQEILTYNILYNQFANYCNEKKEKVDICGLSLGGILALDYAVQYPNKVNSLILIGTPYQIPKFLFKLQNLLFKVMPKSSFNKIGIKKSKFIELVNSMANIEIANKLGKIKCKTLVLCGVRDKTNLDSAKKLNNAILNSTLKIVVNSSHEVNKENPEELSKIIKDFWE